MNHQELTPYLPAGVAPTIHGRLATYPVKSEDIIAHCLSLAQDHKFPLKLITACDNRPFRQTITLLYVFSIPGAQTFLVPSLEVQLEGSFPSLTPHLHLASLYERLIKEFFGLTPTGHPNPQPVLLRSQTNPYVFSQVAGEGIYEIPVGPVHAGIIEPGHFRFSMAGEEIINLEAQLGFVHKGTEKLLATVPLDQKVALSEHVAGETAFSHCLAFTQAIEELLNISVPARARYLRVILNELERLANHLNDIGFIMFDTGYNAGAHGVRLRERIMQLNELLTGHRFLRNFNTIGGLRADISSENLAQAQQTLASVKQDALELLKIASNSQSFINRLKGAGTITPDIAKDYGTVGMVAKACGLSSDARQEFPYAAYDQISFEAAKQSTGDVYARYKVRTKEVISSFHILDQAFEHLPQGPVKAQDIPVNFPKNAVSVGISEGWRGEIMYLIATNPEGEISRVAVRDPSLINWQVVPHAAAENVLLDFPLINKSFNMSYSGNDI